MQRWLWPVLIGVLLLASVAVAVSLGMPTLGRPGPDAPAVPDAPAPTPPAPALPPASASDDWTRSQGDAGLSGRSHTNLPQRPQLLWHRETERPVVGTPLIVGDTVFVTLENGEVRALALASGEERWKRNVGAFINGPAAVASERLLVGDDEGYVTALRQDSGEVVWRVRPGTDFAIYSGVNVVGDLALVGSYDFFVYGLNLDTGAKRWAVETEEKVHALPAAGDRHAIATGCDGLLRAIELGSGEQVVAVRIGEFSRTAPAVDDGVAYACSYEGAVAAVEVDSGEVLWSTEDRYKDVPHDASPALTPAHVIIAGKDGFIRALRRVNGTEVWSVRAKGEVTAPPVVAGGRVFVGGTDGKLRAIVDSTGEVNWLYDLGARVQAAAALSRGRLVVGDEAGGVWCFGEGTNDR